MLNNHLSLVLYFERQLQRFWGASGDYWQSKWEYLHQRFIGDGDNILPALWGEIAFKSVAGVDFGFAVFFFHLNL